MAKIKIDKSKNRVWCEKCQDWFFSQHLAMYGRPPKCSPCCCQYKYWTPRMRKSKKRSKI